MSSCGGGKGLAGWGGRGDNDVLLVMMTCLKCTGSAVPTLEFRAPSENVVTMADKFVTCYSKVALKS